jgi:hypothetical protein
MDGDALILCEGYFARIDGKTANGLVRHTDRYNVVGVIDSTLAGRDAGEVLDGEPNGIPIYRSLDEALSSVADRPSYLVIAWSKFGMAFVELTEGQRCAWKRHIRRCVDHIAARPGVRWSFVDFEIVLKWAKTQAENIVPL